jgi:hypothetical protein
MKHGVSKWLILCSKCTKSHLRASVDQKIFLGSLSLAMRGGKKRVGRGKGWGREGKEEGRGGEGGGKGEGRGGEGKGKGRGGRGRVGPSQL